MKSAIERVVLVLIVAVALVWFPAQAQQRRLVEYDGAALQVTTVQIEPLGDGGCWYRVCGRVTSVDGGGAPVVACEATEATTPAGRGLCVAAFAQVSTTWLARQGFLTDAGVP